MYCNMPTLVSANDAKKIVANFVRRMLTSFIVSGPRECSNRSLASIADPRCAARHVPAAWIWPGEKGRSPGPGYSVFGGQWFGDGASCLGRHDRVGRCLRRDDHAGRAEDHAAGDYYDADDGGEDAMAKTETIVPIHLSSP